MQKFSWRILFSLLLFGFFIFVFSFKLIQASSFEGDLARDAYDMLKIAKGDFTLLGPKLSFGGLYSSPLYYYLFASILKIFTFKFEAVILANATLFALVLGISFYLFSQKHGYIKALLFSLGLGFSPLYLYLARHPGNAFTIMVFLFLLLIIMVKKSRFSRVVLIALGFLCGAVISLHPVTLLVILVLFPAIYKRTDKKLHLIYFFSAFLIPFLPLVVFELKHNFIMLTNTFIHQSYKMFVNNENLGGPSRVSANPIINLFILSSKIGNYLVINPLWLLLISIIVTFKKKSQSSLVLISVFSLILISVFLRHQFARHYLYPFAFLILFTFLYTLIKSKYFYLILVYLAFLFFNFPKTYYQPTSRQLTNFKNAVNQVIKKDFISAKENLNVIQVRKDIATTPYGFEYRYYLLLNGYPTLSEFQYPQSQNLLVFSETDVKPKQINNWEIDQFGKVNWKKVKNTRINDLQIYLINK